MTRKRIYFFHVILAGVLAFSYWYIAVFYVFFLLFKTHFIGRRGLSISRTTTFWNRIVCRKFSSVVKEHKTWLLQIPKTNWFHRNRFFQVFFFQLSNKIDIITNPCTNNSFCIVGFLFKKNNLTQQGNTFFSCFFFEILRKTERASLFWSSSRPVFL